MPMLKRLPLPLDLDAADLYEWNEFLKRLPDEELVEIVLERIPEMEEEILGSLHAACGHELLDRDYRKGVIKDVQS